MGGNGLLAIFLQVIIYMQTVSVRAEDQLFEGRNCMLENGDVGTCKKLPDCPFRVTEVQEGKRDSVSPGRCSFDNFTEIVCCPLNNSNRIRQRPADIACQQYNNIVTNLPPDTEKIPPPPIYNGFKARQGEFPFMVALGYANEDSEFDGVPIKYSCGGSLISSRHVLTAAHCVNNLNNKVPVQIWLGHVELESVQGQVIQISDIILHPQYRRTMNYNDIAILKLKKEVQFTHVIRPICLHTTPLNSTNVPLSASFVVAGWGSTSLYGDSSTVLMVTPNLSIVDLTECAKSYNNFLKLPRGLDDNMTCVLHTDTSTNRADACHGDSGGPLIMESEIGVRIAAITAFGQTCAGPIPGVYTSVYPYLGWIEEQVWPELKEPV